MGGGGGGIDFVTHTILSTTFRSLIIVSRFREPLSLYNRMDKLYPDLLTNLTNPLLELMIT
jgi:hypothetical protein